MKSSFKIALYLIVVLFFAPSISSAQKARRTAEIVYTTIKPRVDGDLSDSVWAKAKPIDGYTQYSPNRLEPAKLKTEV